jgi:Ca2+-dependent lipid-binding protein
MGIFKKEKVYTTQKDVGQIINQFVTYLQQKGFKTQYREENGKAIVQAQKGGILRDLIDADRALTFTFEKVGNQLKVTAGIGKWIQNLAVTAVETIILSPLFLAIDVPEMLWTEHVESEIMKGLEQIVSS